MPKPGSGDPQPKRPSRAADPGSPEGRARRCALSLPGAVEQDHHGFPSFRVAKKIFATLPTPQVLRVFVDDESIRSAVQRHPDCCEPVHWGAKVLGAAFDLDVADHELIEEYLTEAWASRATPSLLAQRDSGSQSPEPGA